MHDSAELATAAPAENAGWKHSLADVVRDPGRLIDILALPEDLREPAARASVSFPLAVPHGLISRMRRGDPDDPLLKQVLPTGREEVEAAGYSRDPVGELEARRAPGLIHKYHGRALLVTVGVCAVNCRYCFRRHYPYEEGPRGIEAWEPAIREIDGDPTLREIILSGGDPLVLTDPLLKALVARLEAVPHLRRLRVHSRFPIVIPERVNDELIDWLTSTRLAPWFIVHANHPREIDVECGGALGRLVTAGIPVLNQSVLLAGVNDDPDTLVALSEKLVDLRVVPAYLHQLDPVEGAAHFHVAERRGIEIVAEMRARLPGFAVPRYVREVRGAPYKIEIACQEIAG